MAEYLVGAKIVEIDDPYLRLNHQIQNFVRFCEAVVKSPTIKVIKLSTSYDESTDVKEMSDHLSDIQQSLLEMDIQLDIDINEHLHDREIRIDNGWTIKIGRGLDFYQKPDSWFGIGANDLSLRKCLETKIDVYRK
jgi:ATP-dependent Lon protease